jgi:ABC-type amino acid transport substrate-binding protein
MKNKKISIKEILLAALLGVFLSNPLSARELMGTLHDIKESGEIKIGYRASLPPMSYQDNKGQPKGYSIDLCKFIIDGVEREIGEKISAKYIAVKAKDRFEALSQKKIDILCGAASETISRRKIVDFTKPIFVTGGSYLVRKGSQIRNNFAGKKIGVVSNTTTAAALIDLFKDTDINAEIVPLNTTAEGFNSLLDGEIDAFSADQVVLIGLVAAGMNLGEFSILPDLFSFELIAFAVRRNDADFRLVADRVLSDLYRCNEIQAIYDKWFGEITGEQPPAIRTLFQLNSIPE